MSEDAPMQLNGHQEHVDAALQAGIAAGIEAATMTPEEERITEGRVRDPAKAKEMALASREYELEALEERHRVDHYDIRIAERISSDGADSAETLREMRNIADAIALDHRAKADSSMQHAADRYDSRQRYKEYEARTRPLGMTPEQAAMTTGREQDPERARAMAYASKEHEEAIIAAKALANESAENAGRAYDVGL